MSSNVNSTVENVLKVGSEAYHLATCSSLLKNQLRLSRMCEG